MFKREMKCNLKSFLIWSILSILIFLVVFLVYPSITNNDTIQNMDELMNAFPEEMLVAFNMDITSVTTVFGYLKTEGFIFVLLIVNCYAATLGGTILLKEENEKTIEYLNSVPIKRSSILLNKALAGLIYVIGLTLVIAIFNFIGLELSGDFSRKEYLLLSITPIFSSIVIYGICLFISTFAHKTKLVIGISLGVVLISYLLNTLAGIADSVEFLKYFSPFTLADTRNVILDVAINPIMVIISIGLTIMFIVGSLLRYEKKNLIA